MISLHLPFQMVHLSWNYLDHYRRYSRPWFSEPNEINEQSNRDRTDLDRAELFITQRNISLQGVKKRRILSYDLAKDHNSGIKDISLTEMLLNWGIYNAPANRIRENPTAVHMLALNWSWSNPTKYLACHVLLLEALKNPQNLTCLRRAS